MARQYRTTKLTAAVVEPQPVMRRALEEALQRGGFLVLQAEPAFKDLRLRSESRLDAILAGFTDGAAADIATVRSAATAAPESRVIVIAPASAEASASAAFVAGACAFILKSIDPPDLVALVRQIVFGNIVCAPNPLHARTPSVDLTPRQTDILSRVATGSSSAAIAAELHISEATVKFHLRNTYRKLGVQSRTDAVRLARDLHVLPPA
jgi:DNA-binding NarL/FixJ family response regulator